jgi:hypothetical protein
MRMQYLIGALVLSVSLLFSAGVLAGDPLEYKLACLNANKILQKDHITVSRFRSLLSQLSNSFSEEKNSIADMSAKSHAMLRDEGVDESLLNVMEGINRIVATNGAKRQYSSYAADYVMLRKKGYNHNDTLKAIVLAL